MSSEKMNAANGDIKEVVHDPRLPAQGAPVITVRNVSKCYHSYQKPLHRLMQAFASKTKKQRYFDEFWALNEVDLTVHRGETVGIVGKNGSGKSTLLQIITGILQPTSGVCETHGRISALLELGAGFNPEFTGMENARLNASIMGLSREEFRQKLPDIVAFCGIGEFMHRPVKTYSSGMFVRLAFAVAINMNPDILIIDEALAVGDVRFQRKCFRRLDELKAQGVSILFVTHSTDSVINHCDRAIMLDDGQLHMTDTPKAVVQAYLEKMFASDMQVNTESKPASKLSNENKQSDITALDPLIDHCPAQATYNTAEHRWGDGRAQIFAYELTLGNSLDNDASDKKNVNNPVSDIIYSVGDRLTVSANVYFHHALDDVIYGLTVKTADGNAIYGTNSRITQQGQTSQKAGDLVTLNFELTLNLLAGDYFISLGVAQEHDDKDNIAIDRRYDLIHIRIDDTPTAFGIADLNARMSIVAQ